MQRIITVFALLLVLGGGLAACGAGSPVTGETAPTPTALPPVLASADVIAEAKVVPIRSASLRFETAGTVAEILVREGDAVSAGQPLARLDTRDLELKLADAQANLASAQAAYDKLAADATPEEIAAAQASVAQAQGQLTEIAGQVSPADLAAAQANLASAQASLDRLLAGPKASELADAQGRLDAAQALVQQRQVELQQTRDRGSQAKTDAERALQQATLDLQTAQSEYSTAYWNYKNVQDKRRAPSETEGRDNPELSDYGNLQEYEAFKQAELRLQTAQLALEQANKNLESTRQSELSDIAQAEQLVANAAGQRDQAQAQLDDVADGADADAVASARAAVASAQAQLNALTGQQRAGSIAAAEAGVGNAQAQLATLQAPKRAVDLGEARARIQQSEVAVQQAELARDKATLVAPIDGTIAALDLEIGELADTSKTVLTLGDLTQLEIQTDDLTELQVVGIAAGNAVSITFDALPGVVLSGSVARVKALGEDKQGDVTYTVTVLPDAQDPRLRWNMTASVAIRTR